jgi:hypothetical protein
VIILPANEDAVIDSFRPQVDNVSPFVSQQDDPGNDLQALGGVKVPELPDPAIGGENGSRIRNGFSTGFRSYRNRIAAFTGAMASPPAIENPVQGNVGQNNRAGKLHAGVMNQLVQYVPDQASYVASYVGSVSPTVIARGK